MLPVRAPRDRIVGRAFRQISQLAEHLAEQAEQHAVRAAQLEHIAGLCDVLRRRAPVRVAACIARANPIQLPDQRHQRVTGHGQPVLHTL